MTHALDYILLSTVILVFFAASLISWPPLAWGVLAVTIILLAAWYMKGGE